MAASVGQAVIKRAEITRTLGNMFVQKGPVTDAANTLVGGDLVKIAAGALVRIATNEVLLFGQVLDKSHASTDIPPEAFFGENHYVIDPRDCILEINIGAANGADVQTGTTGKNVTDLVLGTSYEVYVPTTGTYTGYPFLDPTASVVPLFIWVGRVDGQQDTDANTRVLVKPVPTTIQP